MQKVALNVCKNRQRAYSILVGVVTLRYQQTPLQEANSVHIIFSCSAIEQMQNMIIDVCLSLLCTLIPI